MDRPDGTGINVAQVVDDTLAAKHGVKNDDVLQSVYGKETPSIEKLREALIAARDEGAEEIVVKVLREEKEVELKVPFDVQRDSAPKVELPAYDRKEFDEPTAIDQLADLPKEFSELESQLDDACVEISSELSDGQKLTIVGTRIIKTPLIVSKSSMVMQNPMLADSEVKLEVVARDNENDLVLLKAATENSAGVQFDAKVAQASRVGSFLITPDSDGPGLMSVVSAKAFASRKQQSRGFLGVTPADHKDKGGAVLRGVSEDGAADRAGLEVGDVVTKLNETVITSHMDMRRFLGTVDPNTTIVAKITRGEEELEKSIRLGAYPSFSNHAADQMNKSGRRDGFSKVISHDADLEPGGPVFDLDGNFVGLNIARNSRVRSYAIPSGIVKQLIDRQ